MICFVLDALVTQISAWRFGADWVGRVISVEGGVIEGEVGVLT